MTNFAYEAKDDLSDAELVGGVQRIRDLLDSLRALDPHGHSEVYLATYEDCQDGYNAILSTARRRGVALPEWSGDLLHYSDLDGWTSLA